MKLSAAIVALLLFVELTTGITPQVKACQSQDEILYSQDFNDGSAEEWGLDPGWSIGPSEGGFALQGNGHSWAVLEEGSWGDYFLQFRVNLQENSILHANIRRSGFKRYFIGLERNHSYISRQDGEAAFQNELARGKGIAAGWHTVRVSAVGGTIDVQCDGKKLIAYTDPNPLTNGGVAFENLKEASVLVDDVLIGLASTVETPITTAPTAIPTGKTASQPPTNLTWTWTSGPLGGMGYDVRMSPDNPDVLYVTDAKAGVFKSTDGGISWQAINNGITARTGETNEIIPIFSLTISPTDPNLIWVGTKGVRGAFKSTDAGKTWKKMDSGISYPALTLRGFAIDPRDNNIVYTAGELSSWEWSGTNKSGKEFDLVKGIVYKSTNGGKSWQEIWKGNNLGRYILIDPRNPEVLYLSTGIFDREAADSDWKTNKPGGEGILKSTDGGKTWRRINNGLGNWYVGSLFMHPTNPDILLAGTGNNTFMDGGGVYITKDAGETWQYTSLQTEITSVEISSADPNIAYAGNYGESFRSTDGGLTWQETSKMGDGWGPPGLLAGQPIDFQADPRDPDRVFANAYGGGNFLTEDGGRTWVDVSSGYTGSMVRDIAVDPKAPGHVYAAARSGFFETLDGGDSWQTPNTMFRANDYHALAIDPSDSAHILSELSCERSLLNSRDGGRSFSRTVSNSANKAWRVVAFAPSDPSIAYAGSSGYQSCGQFDFMFEGSGLLRSEDGGQTWKEANDLSTSNAAVNQIAIDPHDPLTAYAATNHTGLVKTVDGGNTWEAAGAAVFTKSVTVHAVEIAPQDSNLVYASKWHGGLWISTDAGKTWKRTSNGLKPEAVITDIVFDPTDQRVMYVADLFGGVFRSQDGGKTWKMINTGLLNRAINRLAISADGLHLYAATEGMGVFRLDLNGQPPDRTE